MQKRSEAVHIIRSMLVLAGALGLSYLVVLGRGEMLVWPGGIDTVVGKELAVDVGGIIDRQTEAVLVASKLYQEDEAVVTFSSLLEGKQDSPALLSDSLTDRSMQQGERDAGIEDEAVQGESPLPVVSNGRQFFAVQDLFSEDAIDEAPLPLAHTYQRTNNGRFILPEEVGVADYVEYILKDQRNTHYVYLGDMDKIVLPEVFTNGGTVVAIEDDVSINKRQLFGDRVWMISLPAYEARQKVVAIVFFGSAQDAWLLQIDRDRFENEGSQQLANTFAQYYTR